MRHRLTRLAAAVLRQICQVTLRVVISWVIFTVCLLVTLKFMGVSFPSPRELMRSVEGLETLARILS